MKCNKLAIAIVLLSSSAACSAEVVRCEDGVFREAPCSDTRIVRYPRASVMPLTQPVPAPAAGGVSPRHTVDSDRERQERNDKIFAKIKAEQAVADKVAGEAAERTRTSERRNLSIKSLGR